MIDLDEKGSLWLVEDGYVDLFSQSLCQGQKNGPRCFLCQAGAGEIVLSFGPARPDFAVSAICSKAARVRQLCADYRPNFRGSDALNLEGWFSKWASGAIAICELPSKPLLAHAIDTGVKQCLAGEAFYIEEAGRWVSCKQTSLLLCGCPDIAIPEARPFFLAGAWIIVEKECELAVEAVPLVERWHYLWECIETFTELLAKHIVRQHRTKRRDAVHRQELFSEITKQMVRRSVAVLAGMSDPAWQPGESNVATTHLMHACRQIGRAQKLHFVEASLNLQSSDIAESIDGLCRASGVRARRVLLRADWWKQAATPLLLFDAKSGQAVAAIPGLRGYDAYYADRNMNIRIQAASAQTFGHHAYMFYRPFESSRALTLPDVLQFSTVGSYSDYLLIALTGLVGGALALLVPLATQALIDYAIPDAQVSQIYVIGAFLIIGAIASTLLTLARSFAILRIKGRMDSMLQAAIWDRLLRLPLSFFRPYSAGDLAQRSLGINQIREILTGTVLNAFLNGIFSVFSIMLLFWYDWLLATVGMCLIAVVSCVFLMAGVRRVVAERNLLKLSGAISGFLLQTLAGITKFKVTGAEERAFASWATMFSEERKARLTGRIVDMATDVLSAVAPMLSWALLFYVFENVTQNQAGHRLTAGAFIGFFTAFNQTQYALLQLSSALLSAARVVPIYQRIAPILGATPEAVPISFTKHQVEGCVEFNSVSFSYNIGGPLILKRISFKVEPGKMVALVGPSGSGKSTVLRLLLGFEQADAGAIYLDGNDLSTLDAHALRRQMGVVIQSGQLSAGSILSNVVGSRPLTADHAWEALRRAGIEDDVRAMPMGLHTVLSEGGSTLSGGQRQRLLIARAIVHNPKLLLFDEATSALDNRSQAVVTKSLATMRVTRIVIAHRLSTILDADCIHVLRDGSIVESGRYDELMERRGTFYELSRKQVL